MDQSNVRENDLVLPPNTYAFVLDSTKGRVGCYVGPYKSSLSNTDRLVVWNRTTNQFSREDRFEHAIQTFTKAEEGQYVILHDPARNDANSHPTIGTANDAVDLDAGRKIIIPGPVSFPLWPGQETQTIDGHHLKSNQYLVVRVYEPAQAQENAANIIAQGQGNEGEQDATGVLGESDFTMGQLYVIKGTDVSFFIPSTGIEVIPDDHGQYVREAATLERLQYCILLDEDGEKRYVKGPDVVFPSPTEQFITDSNGNRVFKAIELNEQSGLYVKVIADYDEDDRHYTAGEELFLTGSDTPIYFPRPEHTIIEYGEATDGKVHRKHHAIAIPKGEGRYVLDRRSGEVELVTGPEMFLPDPRYQVVVRRILDPSAVEVMYPGNEEARLVNMQYAAAQASQREQVGTEGLATNYLSTANAMSSIADPQETTRWARATRSASTEFGGETTRRGQTYTPPRTITLDTKYDGAVTINIWPGYAVLVTDKAGNRRVEEGPKAVLLEYDETLMRLSLSTGRPKNDARLLRTVYLRTLNNQVSDQITVETKDLVKVTLDLSYRVNFTGHASTKWFDIENYVQLLTDHCRSRLRNVAKRNDIQTFYSDTIDLIRDSLLGEVTENKRRGLTFEENGMHLYDVEVLEVRIMAPAVEALLTNAMGNALTGSIRLSEEEQRTEREERLEELKREQLANIDQTDRKRHQLALDALKRELATNLATVAHQLQVTNEEHKVNAAVRGDLQEAFEQETSMVKARNEIEIERMRSEVELFVTRVQAISGDMIEALRMFGDQSFIENLLEAMGPAAMASGVTVIDLYSKLFKGTPFEGMADSLATRPFAMAIESGNGHGDRTN